jgi:hypothetical protein
VATSQAPIPFVSNQESGWEELAGASPVAINVVVDGKGAVRRRPCIAPYSGAPLQPITTLGFSAVYATANGLLFAVDNHPTAKTIYLVRASGASVVGTLNGPGRPIIAETEAQLVFAAGREIARVRLSDYRTTALPGCPFKATHVVAHDSRLLCNDVGVGGMKTVINYSAPALGSATTGQEQWGDQITALGTSGFFSAEARPDPVVALHDNVNQIFAFGTTTLQTFGSSADAVYAPVGTKELGCQAVYSIIKNDQEFAWLASPRRFVTSDGRQQQFISEAIKGTLDSLARVDDMFGYRVLANFADALVWTSPTDGRSFVYQNAGGWSLWMAWDDARSVHGRFPVNCLTLMGNDNVVGLADGRIAMLDPTASADAGPYSFVGNQRVVAHVTTGFQDRGTDRLKQCLSAKFTLRRGSSAVAPIAFLQFRDDLGDYCTPIPVSFGDSSDREVVIAVRGLGVYRRRQWKWTFSETADHVLAAASEEYEVLGQ